MSADTDRDVATLDGISADPLEAAELRELRRILLERRRAGWLARTGWKWLLALATLAGLVASGGKWLFEHVRYHP